MMSDWIADLRKLDAEFRDRHEEFMSVWLVRMNEQNYQSMLRAANTGDREAQTILLSFTAWDDATQKAMKDGVYPACGNCEERIEEHGLGGFAVVMPVEEKAGVGITCPFCISCMRLDHKGLISVIASRIGREYGLAVRIATQH